MLSRKGSCVSRPDDRRIAGAAVCVTSCKRAVFLLCQRVLPPASERAPAQADGTAVTAGASAGLERRGKLSAVISRGLFMHAVTHGHQPRVGYLVVSAHIAGYEQIVSLLVAGGYAHMYASSVAGLRGVWSPRLVVSCRTGASANGATGALIPEGQGSNA